MTSFHELNPSTLNIEPVALRQNNLHIGDILPLEERAVQHPELEQVARAVLNAKQKNASVIVMMGGHVVREGVQNYVIDLMKQGLVSCIATHGAGIIHDYEFARIGGTTETVSRYIKNGRFGFWQETGAINDCVSYGYREGLGLGESLGRDILEQNFPHADKSILAQAYLLGIPVTVHVGIGYDIICQHPNYDGAAFGATSHKDFLRFAHVMKQLENGVVMNFGSAVMAPEIYLKALSMVRNQATSNGSSIANFTVLVCDLARLPENYRTEPNNTEPGYYFRPWKTMLVRTVKDGGMSYYVCDRHRNTIPQLWTAIQKRTGVCE